MNGDLSLIESVARRVQRQHESAQGSMRAALAVSIEQPEALTPAGMTRLKGQLSDIRVLAVHEMAAGHDDDDLSTAVWDMVDIAELDAVTSVPDQQGHVMPDEAHLALNQVIASALENTKSQIRDALRLDEQTALGALRQLQWKVATAVAQGTSPKRASFTARMGLISGLQFRKPDRAGRKWATAIYTRTAVRALLVSTYVETYLITLLSNGIDTAKVQLNDNSFLLFSITGATPGLPTYEDIKGDYWHPNATRLVV